MTDTPPRRRPLVLAGGKALKTDLRLEGTGAERFIGPPDPVETCRDGRENQLEASRLIIEQTRRGRRRSES